jgi:hypothetical protein
MKTVSTWSLGSVRQWHWVSSALCLVGMLLFSVTGITLNHAADIAAHREVATLEVTLPADLLQGWELEEEHALPLPAAVRSWLADEHGLYIGADQRGRWQDDEFYLALPRPGGDAWLALDPATGEFIYELSTNGWIAYLNDLHKGRNTGVAWSWFIDLFALSCVVFCVSGLLLLARHTTARPATWPLVGLGLVAPLLVVLLFVH